VKGITDTGFLNPDTHNRFHFHMTLTFLMTHPLKNWGCGGKGACCRLQSPVIFSSGVDGKSGGILNTVTVEDTYNIVGQEMSDWKETKVPCKQVLIAHMTCSRVSRSGSRECGVWMTTSFE